MTLNKRQREFIRHLALDPKENATQAAIKAGYSEKIASKTACLLLKKGNIKEAFELEKVRIIEQFRLDKITQLTKLHNIYNTTKDEGLQVKIVELESKLAGILQPDTKIINNLINIKDKTILNRYGIKAQDSADDKR